MIRVEDIKVGSVLEITKNNLIKIAGQEFANKIDPSGYPDRIQLIKVISVSDEKCEIESLSSVSVFVDMVELAMYSEFSTLGQFADLHKLHGNLTEETVNKINGVSHPSHYAWLKDLCGVEPLDICRHLDFNTGNAIKYLLRKDKVDGNKTKTEKRIEDLNKAVFYIQDEIKLLEHGTD